MRTITTHTTVYAFDELSDDAKARAVESLRKDFDYLTSEEAIVETIRANEWEFLEGGQHCTL